MAVRDDEYVACVVRKALRQRKQEAPRTRRWADFSASSMGRAVGDGVVDGGDHVAEDTVRSPSCRIHRRTLAHASSAAGTPGREESFGAADVLIAPRGPETIMGGSIQGAGVAGCGEDFLSG